MLLDLIVLDDSTQSRRRTDPEVVEQYAERYRDGATFPPVVLFTVDGQEYWPGDGIHRCKAAIDAKRASIEAVVIDGDLKAAQVYACSANQDHGVHRTNADKRHAVRRMLELEPKWSNRRISEHVGVGKTMVRDIRISMENAGDIAPAATRAGKDGREYEAPATLENKGKIGQVVEKTTPPEDGTTAGDVDFDPEQIEAEAATVPDVEAMAEWYRRGTAALAAILRNTRADCEDATRGAYLVDVQTRLVKKADDLRSMLHQLTPAELCPHCGGGRCAKCGGAGFVTKQMAESRG